MPLPQPQNNETQDDFMGRCMSDPTMLAEYPGQDQRYAVCMRQFGQGTGEPEKAGATNPSGGDGGGLGPAITATPSGGGGATVAKVGGQPVREFRIIRFGPVDMMQPALGPKLKTFTRQMGETAVAALTATGRRMSIDYEHQSLAALNTRADGLAPAAGWIGRLEVRPDGLWACDVEWTPFATALISGGEYAYFSPVFQWANREANELRAVKAITLTNNPALNGLGASPLTTAAQAAQEKVWCTVLQAQPLNPVPDHPGETGGTTMPKTIAERLRLDPGATEDQIDAALTALQAARDQHAEEALLSLGKQVGIEAKNVDELIGALKARLNMSATAAAADAGVEVERKADGSVDVEATAGLVARVGELERSKLDAEFETICSSGVGRGKITPVMKEPMRKIFHTDRARFDELLGTLPVLAGDRSAFRESTGQETGATDTAMKRAWSLNRPNERGVPLQDEFGGDYDAYVSYCKHEAAGDITICGGK